MSGHKKKLGTLKIICIDISSAAAAFLLLALFTARLVSGESVDGEYAFIIISAALFASGLISAVVSKIFITEDKYPAVLISTAIMLSVPVLCSFVQIGSDMSAAAVIRSTACIAAGRIIPFVIKGNTKRKSKRRTKTAR